MDRVVVTEGIDAGLAWHYGNPLKEQKLLVESCGLVDLANREVFTIEGRDRLTWLHSLTSQNLAQLSPGQAVATLVLSPTGHIEHAIFGVDDGQTFWAWAEPGKTRQLVGWLDSMKFMMDVSIAVREDVRVIWASKPIDDLAGFNYVARRESDFGVEYLVDASQDFDELAESLNLVKSGIWAWEALRIAAGVPRIGVDTDHKTIPNEIGLYATHLDKGCYRGQETVARVHNLGRPPRRLVQLLFDGSFEQLPGVGDQVVLADRPELQVGFVGSVARHYELGPIGLGLVKRNTPPEASLQVGEISAAQNLLVDPNVGLHVKVKL